MVHFVVTYGYAAVLLLMLVESACIPVPSEVTMLCGGAAAAGAVSGVHLNVVAVIAAGTVGNVLGSYVAWAAGRFAGQAAWRRWGRVLRLREHDLVRAERWFDRHGAMSVFVGRLVPVVRTFISLPAGVAAMKPLPFGVYTIAGCLPWSAALASTGYAIGGNWRGIADAFHGPTLILAAVLTLAVAFGLMRWLRHQRLADELE